MKSIYIVTEDILSEIVIKKIVEYIDPNVCLNFLGRKGNGYIRKNISSFIEISINYPIIVLIDLDKHVCPTALIKLYLSKNTKPISANFCFRVCEKEIESWLFADHQGMISYIGNKVKGKLLTDCDSINDAKKKMFEFLKFGPKSLYGDMIPTQNSISSIGPQYNHNLIAYIENTWDLNNARMNSRSLNKAIKRIEELLTPYE